MSETRMISSINLAHSFNERMIRVSEIDRPYGDYSDPVISIDVLKGGELASKLEIPYENIDDLMLALSRAKDINPELMHTHLHDELDADIGGGQ